MGHGPTGEPERCPEADSSSHPAHPPVKVALQISRGRAKVPNQVQAKGCARVYVRLAANWADPTGAVHGAGDFVDVAVVTLAELEEQGVVENPEEAGRPEWTGRGKAEEPTQAWIGPGDESGGADEAEAPDADEEDR